jgi:trimeric autotransporter adhesin
VVVGNSSSAFYYIYQPGWTTVSDVRFKKDIQDDPHGLDFILRLHPVLYHLNVRALNNFQFGKRADSLFGSASSKENIQKKEGILYSGLIAQEVEQAAGAIAYDFSGIHKPEGATDTYGLDYTSFVVPLINAVQEQEVKISQLQHATQKLSHANEQLVEKNKDLIREITSLERQVKQVIAQIREDHR